MGKLTGKCYCGELEYESSDMSIMKAQCFCRECQFFTGGNSNLAMAMPEDDFKYTKGVPQEFTHPDLPKKVSREFCGKCGTQILARLPSLSGAVILKIGTLDDSSIFNKPDIAIYIKDKQPYHLIFDDVPQFYETPEKVSP